MGVLKWDSIQREHWHEERLVRVLFFYFTVVKLGNVSLLSLSSYYQGGTKTVPPLPLGNMTPSHVLYTYFNLLSNIKLNMFSILSISSSVMFGIDLYNTVIASSCLRVRPLKSLI